MHGPYPGELRAGVIRFVEEGASRRDSPSSVSSRTSRWMRSFRCCTSGEFQEAAARSPDSSLAMASLSKKSLQAAERKRADVARARRRWVREQGMLDPARLVFIDETA